MPGTQYTASLMENQRDIYGEDRLFNRPVEVPVRDVYVPPGGPPQGIAPSRDIFPSMGEENIYRMCRDFYTELEQTDIRPMFPDDMDAASRRIAAFLIGLLGGPPVYQKLYGPPMMRARHLNTRINEQARQTWLAAFRRVLERADDRYGMPEEHLPGFLAFLDGFSAWMVNEKSASGPGDSVT